MSGRQIIKAHLLSYLPTVSGLTNTDAVSNGPNLSQADLPGFAEIGGTRDDTAAGGYEVDEDSVDGLLNETGDIPVRFVARSGETDLAALEATVETWVTTLRDHLRADQTLGGLLPQGSTVRVGRVEIGEGQTSKGARVEYAVAVHYFTRL